jgi:hypothetical protein
MESGWEMCGGRGEGVVRWWVMDGRRAGEWEVRWWMSSCLSGRSTRPTTSQTPYSFLPSGEWWWLSGWALVPGCGWMY